MEWKSLKIKDSHGLNVDIAFITAFTARLSSMRIARLAPGAASFAANRLKKNYSPYEGKSPQYIPFTKHLNMQRIRFIPSQGCLIMQPTEDSE